MPIAVQKLPKKLREPLIENEDEDTCDDFPMVLRAGCPETRRPGLREITEEGTYQELEDPGDCYPGRWAQATLSCFAYDNASKGVSFGIENVLLLDHDECFGGRPADPDEDFGEDDDL